MAWNINIMAIKTPYSELDDVLDVMKIVRSGASFEEATSVALGYCPSTTFINGHILIIDVMCRFFHKSQFPKEVSLKYDLKMYQMRNTPGYMLRSGGEKTKRLTGVKDFKEELAFRKIPVRDKKDGESMAWQIFDDDIFGQQFTGIANDLWNAKFDIWALD